MHSLCGIGHRVETHLFELRHVGTGIRLEVPQPCRTQVATYEIDATTYGYAVESELDPFFRREEHRRNGCASVGSVGARLCHRWREELCDVPHHVCETREVA